MDDRRTTLEAEILGPLRNWLNAHDAGRDPYYETDQHVRTFTDEEWMMAEHLRAAYPPGALVCEVGTGRGQLAALLAMQGLRAIGVECSSMRAVAADALARHLIERGLPSDRIQIMHGTFPTTFPAAPPVAVITSNVVSGWWGAWSIPDATKIPAFFRGADAVVNTRLWWVTRETPAARAEVVRAFEAAGYRHAARITEVSWRFHGWSHG